MNIEKLAATARSLKKNKGRKSLMTPEILDATRSLRSRGFSLRVIYEALKKEKSMPYKSLMCFSMAWKNR